MKKIILFNKETGTFFGNFDTEGFNVSGIDENLFLYKEIELGDDEFWYGDYETGAIYNSKEITIVSQTQIRDNAIKEIFSKYSLIRQSQIVIDQLKALIAEEDKTADFKEMAEFIDGVRAEYHLKKETFSSDPEAYIWVSDEEQLQNIATRYTKLI